MSTKKNQKTIAILIDSQNVCLDEKSLSILLEFAHLEEKIVTANYYFNSISSGENNKKQQLEKL